MLQTKKVFIDTQYFVNKGLNFDSAALELFKKYCEDKELFHISTSVVDREVKSHINISVKDAINAMHRFRRKACMLSSLEDEHIKGLFIEIPEEDIYKKAIMVFEEFMTGCETEIVNASNIDVENILTLYFEKKPPFGDGKKKSEFPDAFSLYSLKLHLNPNEKIYVVSEDGDMKAFCESNPQFVNIESLDKLLDIYTQHEDSRNEQVKQYFTDNSAYIKDRIKAYLEDCEVYNQSSWADAEVCEGPFIRDMGDIDPSVLFISDNESQITFDIDVDFSVGVRGPDYYNGVYDYETGTMHSFDYILKRAIISKTFTVEISLNYEFLDGILVDVQEDGLYIPSALKGIKIAVEEDHR